MLRLSQELFAETFHCLRSCGAGRRECVAYWLGPLDAEGEVTEVVHPRHLATVGSYDVDGAWVNALWLRLAHEKLQLLAQVHTHPSRAYHSGRDDAMGAIQTVGFRSLVIPDFALGPVALDGAHLARRDDDGEWQIVSTEEIEVR